MNARSLLGPKMRAAGFVNLPNTLGSRSDLSFPSTPSSPSVYSSVSGYVLPTPSDPPIFPPIVFVNPTAVTTTSMWEYQRSMNWNLLSQDHGRQAGVRSSRTSSPASTGSSEFTPVAPAASSSSPLVLHATKVSLLPILPRKQASSQNLLQVTLTTYQALSRASGGRRLAFAPC